MSMIKKVLMICAVVFGIFSSCMAQEDVNRGYIVNVGDKAPVFTTTLDNGKTFNLADCKGKVVMLQFTASWCPVCRKEMPFIEKEIWQEYKNKGLIVVGVDRDEPMETMKKFSESVGITYPLAVDKNADIFGLYALKKAGVTRNVIIDRNGNIVYETRLYNREEFDSMKAKIAELMKK